MAPEVQADSMRGSALYRGNVRVLVRFKYGTNQGLSREKRLLQGGIPINGLHLQSHFIIGRGRGWSNRQDRGLEYSQFPLHMRGPSGRVAGRLLAALEDRSLIPDVGKNNVLVTRSNCLTLESSVCYANLVSASADRDFKQGSKCWGYNTVRLQQGPLHNKGSRPFGVSGPTVWNSLPVRIRAPALSLHGFKSQLKTYMFTTS